MSVNNNGAKIITQNIQDCAKFRTAAEYISFANQIKPDVEKYSGRKSLWSGNIVFATDRKDFPAKLWNCDVRILKNSPMHVLLHELIHSCSISYFGWEVYNAWDMAEELSVQFLSQEIARQANIPVISSGYDAGVELIRDFKSFLKIPDDDLQFASELLKQDISQRWDWLEEQISAFLESNATIEDYQKALAKLEDIKQWRPKKKN